MVLKEFTYRGKTVEQIKNMSMDEFMKILPARQRRSLSREMTHDKKILLDKIRRKNKGTYTKNIRTHCRDMIIVPEMIDNTIFIYDGKTFTQLVIAPDMIGHYLGEFALTRKKVAHSAPGVGATRSSAAASVK